MARDRSEPLVELVTPDGRTIGVATKADVHRPPGRLHRAISAFLLDAAGDLLVQRRAPGKHHGAGLWANTACSHPAPGEPPEDAVRRRLAEELGLEGDLSLEAAGTVVYRVTDRATGLVEHEHDHLFVGQLVGVPEPDPAEVDAVATRSLESLAALDDDDREHVPWLGTVLRAAWPSLIARRDAIRGRG
jgi:isopentenyl-diphosphate delta-isomerase